MTPAEKIRAYLKEINLETQDQVHALGEYKNLGASVLAADLEENIHNLTRIVDHLLEGCEKYAPYYKGHYAEQAIEAAASEIK